MSSRCVREHYISEQACAHVMTTVYIMLLKHSMHTVRGQTLLATKHRLEQLCEWYDTASVNSDWSHVIT
jgi:hypothetical protein